MTQTRLMEVAQEYSIIGDQLKDLKAAQTRRADELKTAVAVGRSLVILLDNDTALILSRTSPTDMTIKRAIVAVGGN